jgi:hypothetical protein
MIEKYMCNLGLTTSALKRKQDKNTQIAVKHLGSDCVEAIHHV